jgi:hypothetical protein
VNDYRWNEDHGDDGLRRKFDVYKHKDALVRGQANIMYPTDALLGTDGEFIFVLRPETDYEAVCALLMYSLLVKGRAPQLAADINTELDRIMEANGA